MKTRKNIKIQGKHNKPILIDVYCKSNNIKKPVLIFCHGYKGYKDWGAWNIMAEHFAKHEISFIKFNFSFNGGTAEQPIDFPDLVAFGNNNYTKELDDLDIIINWVETEFKNHPEIDTSNINLLGHSRGGGIVTIKAEEDFRIKKIISLAGVSDYRERFPIGEALKKWKNDGVMYVINGRTKQNMPHYFQFYEDFITNEERLTIKRAAQNLKIPHLVIHGDNDTSVSPQEAKNLNKWNPKSILKIVKGADHVFNTRHPWNKINLTSQLKEVVEIVSSFINGK